MEFLIISTAVLVGVIGFPTAFDMAVKRDYTDCAFTLFFTVVILVFLLC